MMHEEVSAELARVPSDRTGRVSLKKFPKGSERLGFLNFGVVEGLDFLARFGPSGPKPDPLVVTSAFVDINFVGKVSQMVCRVYSGALRAPSHQKCEQFLAILDFASE